MIIYCQNGFVLELIHWSFDLASLFSPASVLSLTEEILAVESEFRIVITIVIIIIIIMIIIIRRRVVRTRKGVVLETATVSDSKRK